MTGTKRESFINQWSRVGLYAFQFDLETQEALVEKTIVHPQTICGFYNDDNNNIYAFESGTYSMVWCIIQTYCNNHIKGKPLLTWGLMSTDPHSGEYLHRSSP